MLYDFLSGTSSSIISSTAVMPTLVRSLNALALALVAAILIICGAIILFTDPGLASPISVNMPSLVFAVAVHIAVISLLLSGVWISSTSNEIRPA